MLFIVELYASHIPESLTPIYTPFCSLMTDHRKPAGRCQAFQVTFSHTMPPQGPGDVV